MEQLERIARYEAMLDELLRAEKSMDEALAAFASQQQSAEALSAYYASAQWREDFESDEAGKLPRDLKRGVLSEDGIYHALTERRRLFIEMLKTAAELLERGLA